MKGFRSLFLTFLPLGAEAAFNLPVFAINLTLVFNISAHGLSMFKTWPLSHCGII